MANNLTIAEIETLSLTESLRRLGIEHSKDAHSHCDARHTLRRIGGGETLGRFDATDGWVLVLKLIAEA